MFNAVAEITEQAGLDIFSVTLNHKYRLYVSSGLNVKPWPAASDCMCSYRLLNLTSFTSH